MKSVKLIGVVLIIISIAMFICSVLPIGLFFGAGFKDSEANDVGDAIAAVAEVFLSVIAFAILLILTLPTSLEMLISGICYVAKPNKPLNKRKISLIVNIVILALFLVPIILCIVFSIAITQLSAAQVPMIICLVIVPILDVVGLVASIIGLASVKKAIKNPPVAPQAPGAPRMF